MQTGYMVHDTGQAAVGVKTNGGQNHGVQPFNKEARERSQTRTGCAAGRAASLTSRVVRSLHAGRAFYLVQLSKRVTRYIQTQVKRELLCSLSLAALPFCAFALAALRPCSQKAAAAAVLPCTGCATARARRCRPQSLHWGCAVARALADLMPLPPQSLHWVRTRPCSHFFFPIYTTTSSRSVARLLSQHNAPVRSLTASSLQDPKPLALGQALAPGLALGGALVRFSLGPRHHQGSSRLGPNLKGTAKAWWCLGEKISFKKLEYRMRLRS